MFFHNEQQGACKTEPSFWDNKFKYARVCCNLFASITLASFYKLLAQTCKKSKYQYVALSKFYFVRLQKLKINWQFEDQMINFSIGQPKGINFLSGAQKEQLEEWIRAASSLYVPIKISVQDRLPSMHNYSLGISIDFVERYFCSSSLNVVDRVKEASAKAAEGPSIRAQMIQMISRGQHTVKLTNKLRQMFPIKNVDLTHQHDIAKRKEAILKDHRFNPEQRIIELENLYKEVEEGLKEIENDQLNLRLRSIHFNIECIEPITKLFGFNLKFEFAHFFQEAKNLDIAAIERKLDNLADGTYFIQQVGVTHSTVYIKEGELHFFMNPDCATFWGDKEKVFSKVRDFLKFSCNHKSAADSSFDYTLVFSCIRNNNRH